MKKLKYAPVKKDLAKFSKAYVVFSEDGLWKFNIISVNQPTLTSALRLANKVRDEHNFVYVARVLRAFGGRLSVVKRKRK